MKLKDIGRYGEAVAKYYFKNKGYTFLSANFQISEGEIDLIFKKDNEIVAIEVKASVIPGNNVFSYEYSPIQKINRLKLHKIKITLCHFIKKHHQYRYFNKRVDLIGVRILSRVSSEDFKNLKTISEAIKLNLFKNIFITHIPNVIW